jgi:4'-phosphopantetheinyl transferase
MFIETEMNPAGAKSWESPPLTLKLQPGEVHIWRGSLAQPCVKTKELLPLLSEEEKDRAGRFRFSEDAERYIRAHGMMRDTFFRYRGLGAPPLRFCAGPHGKPCLSPASSGPALRFNLSHSDSLALIAITLDCDIGVDVEPHSRSADWEALASRYFSTQELEYLFNLPVGKRELAFLRLWTQKEAYVKGRGDGLSRSLHSFSFLTTEDGTLRVEDSIDLGATANWWFLSLTPDEQHVGTLAMEGRPANVLFWNWPGLSTRY